MAKLESYQGGQFVYLCMYLKAKGWTTNLAANCGRSFETNANTVCAKRLQQRIGDWQQHKVFTDYCLRAV